MPATAAPTTITIRRLMAPSPADLAALTDVLVDCVEGGASVSFMLPMKRETALAFWQRVAAGVRAGERALLLAEDEAGFAVLKALRTAATPPLVAALPGEPGATRIVHPTRRLADPRRGRPAGARSAWRAGRGDCGGRQHPQGLRPARRRAGLFLEGVRGLWPRGRGLHALRGPRGANHPGRAQQLVLPEVPEVGGESLAFGRQHPGRVLPPPPNPAPPAQPPIQDTLPWVVGPGARGWEEGRSGDQPRGAKGRIAAPRT